jgi:hypothetical protein
MLYKKFRLCAQVVGCITIGLLAVYGLVAIFGGGDLVAWASGRAAVAAGSVPAVMNYQGHLKDDSGVPLDGTYDITFRIYASVSTPTALWTETHTGVTVREGYFSVLLGYSTPLPDDLFAESDRYIGVTVAPYEEMTPRQRFASVPYAFRAERAFGLSAADGAPADAVVVDNDGNVTVSGAHNSGTVAALKIQSGSHSMLLDGNEIDSDDTLHLNYNSPEDVTIAHGGGDVTIERIKGNVTVSGDENSGTVAALKIQSGSHSMLLDGNEIDSSGTLYLNHNSPFAVNIAHGGGDVQVENDLDVTGTVDADGLTISGDKPIFIRRFTDLGNNANYDTQISIANYQCGIVGFHTGDVGGTREMDVWDFSNIYLYIPPGGTTWYIRANTEWDHHDEWPMVTVMCISTGIASRVGPDTVWGKVESSD